MLQNFPYYPPICSFVPYYAPKVPVAVALICYYMIKIPLFTVHIIQHACIYMYTHQHNAMTNTGNLILLANLYVSIHTHAFYLWFLNFKMHELLAIAFSCESKQSNAYHKDLLVPTTTVQLSCPFHQKALISNAHVYKQPQYTVRMNLQELNFLYLQTNHHLYLFLHSTFIIHKGLDQLATLKIN